MDAYAIQETYRKIIARYIVNERDVTADLVIGDTSISVSTTRRFSAGDRIVIIDLATNLAEVADINLVADRRTLDLEEPIIANYSAANCVIRKLLGARQGVESFIHGIYLGDPPVISHYPAITIDMKSRSSEWMTLESTKETYNVDITVYVEAAHYQDQYKMMHVYMDQIEQAFFRSFYPLVEPYTTATLANDIDPEDTIFRIVTDPYQGDAFRCATGGWIWFESLDFLRFNRIKRYLGNGVYEVARPIAQQFSSGDVVISPRRHIFNQLPEQTRYGTVNKEGTMLKAGVCSIKCEEEVLRRIPFKDPLTF